MRLRLPSCASSAIALAAVAIAIATHAQSITTAEKSAGLSAFGAFSSVNQDYTGTPSHINGMMFGVDATRYLRLPFAPSIEGRAIVSTGPVVSQRSYVFGPRVELLQFGRFRPYADFLMGPGNIHFMHPIRLLGDNSTVYNYGGGMDIAATRRFDLRLDYQAQHWQPGKTTTFSPNMFSVGVQYRVPFRFWNRTADSYIH